MISAPLPSHQSINDIACPSVLIKINLTGVGRLLQAWNEEKRLTVCVVNQCEVLQKVRTEQIDIPNGMIVRVLGRDKSVLQPLDLENTRHAVTIGKGIVV